MKKIIKWLDWRGITFKDLLQASVSLGLMFAMVAFLVWGVIQA